MKTAIYIEDGVVQLVITPESEFERSALSSFQNDQLKTSIFEGQFYDCRGGWIRQKEYYPNSLHPQDRDKSLILRVDKD